MLGRYEAWARWHCALASLALLMLGGASRVDAQSDVPLGVRRASRPAPGGLLRAMADVALCRTFDCERAVSAAVELAPSSRWRITGEGAAGRDVMSPASPTSADARVDLFYGSDARQVWIGKSASRFHGGDSLGAVPTQWLEYGAAMRWRSISAAVDIGAGVQPAGSLPRPSARLTIFRSLDSLTGTWHEDTVARLDDASSAPNRARWRSAALRLGWQSDQWRLGAVLGRASSQLGRAVVWTTTEAERRIGRSLAIVATIGNYPGSVATNAPRSRWMMGAGLALFTGPRTNETPSPPSRAPASEQFAATLIAPARYRIVAHLPDAARVEIAADFTGWQPVAMQREAEDVWSVEIATTPGAHRVSLRHDDGPWRAPPGLVAQEDGFGGSAGVFVIP